MMNFNFYGNYQPCSVCGVLNDDGGLLNDRFACHDCLEKSDTLIKKMEEQGITHLIFSNNVNAPIEKIVDMLNKDDFELQEVKNSIYGGEKYVHYYKEAYENGVLTYNYITTTNANAWNVRLEQDSYELKECEKCEATGYVYIGFGEKDVKECSDCDNGYIKVWS